MYLRKHFRKYAEVANRRRLYILHKVYSHKVDVFYPIEEDLRGQPVGFYNTEENHEFTYSETPNLTLEAIVTGIRDKVNDESTEAGDFIDIFDEEEKIKLWTEAKIPMNSMLKVHIEYDSGISTFKVESEPMKLKYTDTFIYNLTHLE